MTPDTPPPVDLVADGPARQRRWTVLIRAIMVIPHVVVLWFLIIAAAVVAFIGWWAALFAGRLPQFAMNYLSGVLRWSTRVQAYSVFLTDQYPPFSFGDEPGYPVRVAIPPRGHLNRGAVLGRIILVIPAQLLLTFVSYGAFTIVLVIAWLIALVTGKLPAPLHQAYTATLRYGFRTYCYFYLLTPTYPWGLFGDGVVPPAPVGADVPAEDAPTAEAPVAEAPATEVHDASAAAPAAQAPEAGAPETDVANAPEADAPATEVPVSEVPVSEASEADDTDADDTSESAPADAIPGYFAPGEEALTDPAAGQEPDWRLLLTRGTRQLLGVFIALGVILCALSIGANLLRAKPVSVTADITKVNAANSTLSTALNSYQTTVGTCQTATCVENADSQAAKALTNFASTISSLRMPGNAVAVANSLSADATKLAQDLTKLSRLGASISPHTYTSTANSLGIDTTNTAFQQESTTLDQKLNSDR